MPYDYLKKNQMEGWSADSAMPNLPSISIDVTQDEYDFITRYAALQADPQKAIFDMQSAILFSRNTNMPVDYCLQNLDMLSDNQIGEKYQPTQTWWKSITNSYKIGELTIDRGQIGKQYARARHNGEDYSQYEEQMKELDSQIEALQDYVPRSWITKALKATAQSIPYTANIAVSRGVAGAVAKGVTKLIPGIADDVIVKAVEWISAIAGTAKTSDIMWGSTYYDLVNKGIDEDVAWYMSQVSGVGSGLIESALGKLLGGATRSITRAMGVTGGSVMNNLTSRMIANGSWGQIGRTLTDIVNTGFGEGSEEFVESIKDKLLENLAYTLSDMDIPVEQDFRTPQGLRNNFGEALDDFIWGALSGIVMGGPTDTYSNAKLTARRGGAMQTIATVSPTYEVFSDRVDKIEGLKDEIFEGNDEQWEKTKRRIYDSKRVADARKTYFSDRNALGDIEESETYDEQGNATKNPRFYDQDGNYSEGQGSSRSVNVTKMSNGRYFSQDSDRKTAEGWSIRKFGSPDATEKTDGKFPLYGQIEYTQDGKGITIQNIRFKNGVSEADVTGMVRQFLQENPDVNVTWDAATDLERNVKESIEKENGGNLTFKSDMDPSDHQAVYDRLDTWMGDLGKTDPIESVGTVAAQTSEGATETKGDYNRAMKDSLATVIQLLGKAEGKTGIEWLNAYIKEIRKGTDKELGNNPDGKGPKHLGAVKADLDETVNRLRATIYYGKNANYSTFEHELHHVVMMQSNHREEFTKLFEKYKNDKQFRDFLARTWSTFSGRFNGKFADLDQLINSLYQKDEWTADDWEFEASLFEAYRAQDQSYKNKPLSSFFGKIASWMRRIYSSIRRNADLNPEITQYFDRLYGAEGKVYEGQDLTFKIGDALMYTAEDQTADEVLQQFRDTEARLATDPSNFDAEGNHLAPNGRPSNLTYKQWVLVRTPNFIRWFGDWMSDPENASKVVDENGEPKVVYHGATASFDIFSKTSDLGFHFGTEQQAIEAQTFHYNNEAPWFGTADVGEDEFPMMQLFLNLRNPVTGVEDPGTWTADNWQLVEDLRDKGFISDFQYKWLERMYEHDDLFNRNGDSSRMTKYLKDALIGNGYDGIIYKNMFEAIGGDFHNPIYDDSYMVFNSNQAKSATDNSGEFNPTNDSILHQAVTDEDEIRKIEKDGTIKLVRMMQIIDGKIYSPINNTWYDDKGVAHMSEPFEVDTWYKAEEHPELAIDKGNGKYDFQMHKTPNDRDEQGRKLTPVTAAYNPYMHASVDWLNDQFKSVIRPNLVYVEVEMPKSDINSGYRAQYAKDPVGPLEWKAGIVTNVVNKYRNQPRTVYLSRYMKIVRVIPDSEVAQHIKEELNGLPMAIEATPPNLRAELERIGVDFVPIKDYTRIYGPNGQVQRWGRPYDNVLNQSVSEAQAQYDEVVAKYKGTDQWLKAPNGKDTNLTERQWVQVRTPNFIRWFGDWINDPQNASKVLDENGEPLVVYHGTDWKVTPENSVFDVDRVGANYDVDYDYNFYFTASEAYAKGYGDVIPVFLNVRNPEVFEYETSDTMTDNDILYDLITAHDMQDAYEYKVSGPEYGEADGAIYYAKLYNEKAMDEIRTRNYLKLKDKLERNKDLIEQKKEEVARLELIEKEMNLDERSRAIEHEIQRFREMGWLDEGGHYYGWEDFQLEDMAEIAISPDEWDIIHAKSNEFYENKIRPLYNEIHDLENLSDDEIDNATPEAQRVVRASLYMVDNPNQIKSATDNTGEFDPENDSILHQTAVDEDYQNGLASGDIRINADGSMTFSNEWAEKVRDLDEGLRGTLDKRTKTVKVRPSLAKRVIAALTGQHRVTGDNTSARYFKDSEGRIVGAPPKYDTPEKLSRLRRILVQLANEGAYGRWWYEESSKAILNAVGGDVNEAKKLAATLAILSPQMKVDANTSIALKAWAQYKAGVPIDVKTKVQNRQLNDLLYNGIEWDGQKTNNFFINLMREIDPTSKEAQGVTVDMWMMRAFGYDNDSPTDAQYQFVEKITHQLAQKLGWEPQQVQAAIWVALKKRTEDRDVKAETEAKSQELGYMHYEMRVDEEDGKTKRVRVLDDPVRHRKLWLETAMGKTIDEISQASHDNAGFNYATGLMRNIGQVSVEAAPSRGSGILQGYFTASPELQAQFLKDVFDLFLDEEGNDELNALCGLLTLGSVDAPSVWNGDISLGLQQLVAIPTMEVDGQRVVTPEARLALDTKCALLGYFLRQDGVAWNKAVKGKNKSFENGVDVDIGRVLTDAEAKSLSMAVKSIGEAKGLTLDGVVMVSSPNGIRLFNNTKDNKYYTGKPFENKEFCAIIKKALENWDADVEYKAKTYRNESGIIENDWEKQPNGEGYLAWFSENGRSDVLRTAIDRYGEATQRLYERYSRDYGWGEPGRVRTSAEAKLNQTSEISDDTIDEIVDSYVTSKVEADTDKLTDLVLSEMRHSIDYPQREYSTVSTPDLLYNLRAVARASSDMADFMVNAEEQYGLEGQEFDVIDLQAIWDDVHTVEIQNQDYGTLTEPNMEVEDKVSQFTDILSDKASFEEFLKGLQNSNLEGASLFMNNLVSRLSNDETLNTEGFRIAYGQVLENPEMYMDLYGQATDNEYWKTSADTGGQIADEMGDEFAEITRSDVAEVASTIQDKGAREALMDGTETTENGAVEKALEENRKRIEELNEERKALEGQDLSDDGSDASDLQRVNSNAKKLVDNAQRYMNERSKEFSEEIRGMFPNMDDEKFAKRFPTIVRALEGEDDFDSEENFQRMLDDTDLLKDQISQLMQKYRTVVSARKNLEKAKAVSKAKQSVRYSEAIKRKNLRLRMEKVNQALKDAYKERQNLKKAKAMKQALARKIMRPVSNNVNWRQARQIMRIQSQIDPNFTSRIRVNGEMMDIRAAKWLFAENPDNPIFDSLSPEQMAKVLSTNLNEMTISDLEVLAMVVDQIRAEGLRERQAYIDAQARVAKSWRDRFIAELKKTGRVSDNPPMKGSQEEAAAQSSIRQKLRNANYALLNMARKAQILDNHRKGSFYDLLIRMKRDVYATEYRAIEKRTSPIEKLMAERKIDYSDFYTNHTINVDGWKTQNLSFSQLLYYYLSERNEKNRQALAYGNLVTDAEKTGPNGIKAQADAMAFDTERDRNRWMNAQVRALGDARYRQIYEQAKQIIESKPELKPIIDAIEADLNSEAFERVREIMLRVFNQEVGKEEYYLPMRRNNLKGKSAEEMMYEDIMKTVPGTRASRSVKKGMTEDRIVISPMNQSSIEADFVKVWADSVTDQEHLVAALEYSKLLNSVFGNSQESATLKSYVEQAYGDAMMKDIQTHIAEIANPNASRDIPAQDQIIRYLRGGLYSAYLGFKASSIVNQAITSPAAFLGKVSPLKLMKGYLTMMAHPKQLWNTVCELSPFMKSRSIDPTRQMIMDERADAKTRTKTGNKAKDAMTKVRDVSNKVFNDIGLRGLDWIDRFCVAGGWWAIYQDELSKMDGGDLEANQKEAARRADEFVYETQPLSDKTELSPFFKNKNEAVNLLTQFQTSLNVVWNNIVFDIPQQLGISGRNLKEKLQNGEFVHALGMIVGYAASGALLLLVTEGFDDDDDDKKKAKKVVYSFFNQPIAAIPLVSNAVDYALKRTVTGDKGMQFNSSNYPLFDKMVRVPYNVVEGDWEKAWTNAWQSIALANGLPYSSINELLRIKDNGLGSLLGRRQ